jgi:hypothetical protein
LTDSDDPSLVFDSERNALAAFSASVQQKIGGSEIDLHRAVRDAVACELRECARAVPAFRADLPEQFLLFACLQERRL